MQEDIIIKVSNRIKDIRKDKNITIQELSDLVGISKGMLSQVENNRTIPSLSVFFNLIKALDIDFNEFFKDINLLPQNNKVIFKKKEQYQPFEKGNATGFHYKRIFSTILNDNHLDFVLLTLEPNSNRDLVTTDAFEFKYLLKGSIECIIGTETFLLKEGDTIFFDATEQHNLVNKGKDDAILFVVYFFNKG